MYMTLLPRIKQSPSWAFRTPFSYSSVCSMATFKNPSKQARTPRYSTPVFSLITTGRPTMDLRNALGFLVGAAAVVELIGLWLLLLLCGGPTTINTREMDQEKRYKVVCLGESSAGKTSLTLRFVKKEFVDSVEPTIGAGFMVGKIGSTTFELWDTAGSERYRSLAPMYYRNSRAAVVAYDLTSQNSFDKVGYWIQELRATGMRIVICLVGSKLDLADEEENGRAVDREVAQQFAQEHGVGFFETSAKTGENVNEVFQWLDEAVRKADLEFPAAAAPPPPPSAIPGADLQQAPPSASPSDNGCC